MDPVSNRVSNILRKLTLLLSLVFGCIILVTIYFSLRSSPNLKEVQFLPDWIGYWADIHVNARTAVPYFILALLWPMVASALQLMNRDRLTPKRFPKESLLLIIGYVGIAVLLLSTEALQIFIPTRFVTLEDTLWGTLGISSGGIVGLLFCLYGKSFIVATRK